MTFRRVNGKLSPGAKPQAVVVRDGQRMAVLRPLTEDAAKKALAEAKAMADGRVNDPARFDKILEDQGQMTFMGLLGKNGRVLDPETLADIGPLAPGDSFVSYEAMLENAAQIVPS